MRLPKIGKIEIGRPQWLAGLLLLMLLGQCLWVVGRQELSSRDYRFARCGREMWERPSPLAGYFTTCGNLNGDGTFAYRVAGLPLTVQRLVLLAGDKLRSPENRLYAEGSLNGSTWEARHEIGSVKYLMHLPFVFFALWLGAGLWWVARRLFGNEGAFVALGLYCFCPEVVRYAVVPNNEVLAMWGLYGLVYTAIGVAHAMQGPRKKWRPRIVLLTVALGLTAAAHLLAAMVGFAVALVLMLYLAERRRSYVMQILVFSAIGCAGDIVCVLCVSAGGFQLCVYRGWGAVLVLAGWGAGVLYELAEWADRGGGCGCAGGLGVAAAEPVLWEHGAAGDDAVAVAAADDADGDGSVALGAAVFVYVCGWGVCGCAGEPAAEGVCGA